MITSKSSAVRRVCLKGLVGMVWWFSLQYQFLFHPFLKGHLLYLAITNKHHHWRRSIFLCSKSSAVRRFCMKGLWFNKNREWIDADTHLVYLIINVYVDLLGPFNIFKRFWLRFWFICHEIVCGFRIFLVDIHYISL